MPKKKAEAEVLSVEITVGIPRSPHVTRFKILPRWNQAQVVEESLGCLPQVIGTVTIPELLDVLRKLREEKASEAHKHSS